MEIDPIDLVEVDDTSTEKDTVISQEQRKNQLNTAVAIAVALLATFIGVCKVKDDNIVQGMQQA
jgi:hypothetical protein